ncbi:MULTISPECIES: cyclic nucleotide-binding domain-containing protein [unclassified Roseovarius]|uniref:cyclic nucleotide-binding domain-containing protein n=1 Tax=unclassified Roseovarius TaxID=2614913 RepID=UPI00273F65F8|nr:MULTISPECIES: cyclic nucleotide-binding domain-containing protein [unclassified Roseovarius]
MGAILTPEVLVLLAGGTFVLGYLTINQVWLRIFVLAGTVLYIWYYATVADAPLWEAIYTSLAMGAANLFGLMSLYAQRSRMIVPAQHRDIYPQFGNLTPGDFRSLVRCADRFVTDTEIELATEGGETEHLYFLINGSARVQKLGAEFRLPSGTFVGEVAYLTGRRSAATTVLAEGSEVLRWRYSDLYRRSAKSSRFKLALEAMIAGDLATKVSFAVAPPNLSDVMKARA